jgi:hypothetical protein
MKFENLENAIKFRAPEERVAKLKELLLLDLQSLVSLCVDGTVLKVTGIVKNLQAISATAKASNTSNSNGSHGKADCAQLALELIRKWKAQIKADNKASTIRSLKGGNVLKM